MVFLKLRVKREPEKSILLLIEHLKLSHLYGLLIRLWIYQIQSPLEIVDEDTTIGIQLQLHGLADGLIEHLHLIAKVIWCFLCDQRMEKNH